MPRGGKRPGAGAPKGNLNALKHGRYSQQFATIGRLLASEPETRETLLKIAARVNGHHAAAAEVAALLLTRLVDRTRAQSRGNRSTKAPDRRRAEELEGLNLSGDTGVWDSIREAGGNLTDAQIQKLAVDLLNETLSSTPAKDRSDTDTTPKNSIETPIENDVDRN